MNRNQTQPNFHFDFKWNGMRALVSVSVLHFVALPCANVYGILSMCVCVCFPITILRHVRVCMNKSQVDFQFHCAQIVEITDRMECENVKLFN